MMIVDMIVGVCTDSNILSLILEILIDCVKSNDVKKVSVFGSSIIRHIRGVVLKL